MTLPTSEAGVRAGYADPQEAAGGFGKVFIIGCPRSGTTWLQLLLAQHEALATAPETQIFAYYLDHFLRQWRHEHEGPGRASQGRAGLSRLLTETEFEELCRRPALLVLERIAAGNPGARYVVEKSPRHALQADFIHRIFPDAYFVHLVRDPRDTVASLLAAGRGWGRGWAPRNAIDAARLWVEHVTRARLVTGRTDRYREIRYETLRERGALELGAVLEWLGVDADEGRCRAAVEACRLDRLRAGADGGALPIPGEKSPEGFFRSGDVGGWRHELSRSEVRVVEHLCGPLMDELGYPRTTRPGAGRLGRVLAHDAIQRVRESVDWQLARLLTKI